MKIRHAIAAGALLALTPMLLQAVDEQKTERKRPDKADWALKKRDSGQPHSQRPAMRDRGMRAGFMSQLLQNPRMAEAVGLRDEQRTQLQRAADSDAQQRKALQERMKAAAMAQARLLTDSDVDEAALMAAVEKTGAIRTELAKLEMRSFLMTRKILTGEQREKIKNMVKHRMQQREKGMRPDRMNREGNAAERPRMPAKHRDDKPLRKKRDAAAPGTE